MSMSDNNLRKAEAQPSGDKKQNEQKLPSFHYPETNPHKK